MFFNVNWWDNWSFPVITSLGSGHSFVDVVEVLWVTKVVFRGKGCQELPEQSKEFPEKLGFHYQNSVAKENTAK